MTCQDMSCVFDSSGGAFPNGYCVWEQYAGDFVVISCHCKEGYCCGTGPIGIKSPYDGQRFKFPCVPKEEH